MDLSSMPDVFSVVKLICPGLRDRTTELEV
jgi:hypothetical protein